jgi:hypothetical protein
MNKTMAYNLCIVSLICLSLCAFAAAQVKTTVNTEKGSATQEVKVERGEVVYVSGNDLIVKMDNGELRYFQNVPESARATVDGKQIGIHDVKVGMKLQRTITTTTQPRAIVTTKSVTGTVMSVMPPTSVLLRMENGQAQRFKIPKNQKFNVEGKILDSFGLKPGMKIMATKVETVPETVVSQQTKITGTMPPPPPPPPEEVAILIVEREVIVPVEVTTREEVVQEEVVSEPEPARLPKTASPVPLIGLLGILSLGLGLLLRAARQSS